MRSSEISGAKRERRLRFAAVSIVVGLAIELVSLRWAHPTAFIVFAAGTGACVGVGILIGLAVLLGSGPVARREADSERD